MLSFLIKDFLTLALENRSRLGVICLAITAGILAACLWPFNFIPRNKVIWLQNENGIRFYGRGIVSSPEPLKLPGSGFEAVTIEFLVRPDRKSFGSWGSILTLFDGDQEQFIFGQWKKHFNVRIPAGSSYGKRLYRHLGVENALPTERARLVTVTSGGDETNIYLNGQLVEHAPHYSLLRENQDLSGYLVIGNSPEGDLPWFGDLLGIAIYGLQLNEKQVLADYRSWQVSKQPSLGKERKAIAVYLFDEHDAHVIRDRSGAGNDLGVPDIFRPLRRTILVAPWNEDWLKFSYLWDVIVNILGFVPFGFFLSAWLFYVKDFPAVRVYGIAILLGFCLSLSIEFVQAFIPPRGSQISDVITNTLGTALGARLLFKYAVPAVKREEG